ncbi:hypothetical protein D9M73_236120 [compost metagenome]
MDHVIELGHHQVLVADHRVVDGMALGFCDITQPGMVVGNRVDTEPDHFGVALVEFRLELGQVAQFSGADRGEILRVRKQDGPVVANPFVEIQRALGAFGSEIRCFVANADCHVRSPFNDGQDGS